MEDLLREIHEELNISKELTNEDINIIAKQHGEKNNDE